MRTVCWCDVTNIRQHKPHSHLGQSPKINSTASFNPIQEEVRTPLGAVDRAAVVGAVDLVEGHR